MVARSSGSITSLINGDELHVWSDYLMEYDQAPRQPDIQDFPQARNGILHVAAQLDVIRKGVESGFTGNTARTDELVVRLNQFGTQLVSILADIKCDSGNKFDTVDKEVTHIKTV